jgi:PST family polysaccharide transporter
VIGRRTLLAMRGNALAGLLRLGVTFVRYVALARLLPVELFGAYALAVSIVHVTKTLAEFGLAAAFLHRAPETQEEEPAASVLFTLRLGFTVAWGLALSAAAFAWAEGALRSALLALVACSLLAEPAFVPWLIFVRRLQYRRIVLYDALAATLGTAAAVALALAGAGLWALLATNAVAAALQLAIFLGVAPPWRPRLHLDARVARHLLRFGSRALGAEAVGRALERLPDLWVGGLLGDQALGFYSRAQRLAGYSQELATSPLASVLPATYAELATRRAALADAARTSLAALVRVGAGLAAVLIVAAPALVDALLGERWRPAIAPFRVLCALVALEPLRLALTGLLVALGRPGTVARHRATQLGLLAAGLVAGAGLGSTTAVAWACVGAACACALLMGAAARSELELPLARIFALPPLVAAAAAAAGLAWAPAGWPQPAAVALVYAALLAALDRSELARLAGTLRAAWGAR